MRRTSPSGRGRMQSCCVPAGSVTPTSSTSEEIADIAKRERRALRCRLVRLMQHLLKWQYQPEKRGSSRKRTIAEQRDAIEDILRDSPSLRRGIAEIVAEA